MAHRISSLPLAELCPYAPTLSEQYGSGRAAAVSTAFHAMDAGEPDADAKLAALTPEERAELESWHRPHACTMDVFDATTNFFPLDATASFFPDHCEREEEVSLSHTNGSSSLGHVDMYSIAIVDGKQVLLVCDIKRSLFTTGASPDSLQLAGYGFALCDTYGVDHFVPGIFAAREGEYRWGSVVSVDSPQGYELRERCEYAATHTGEARTGPHCNDCYQQHHCKEHLMPAALAEANPDLQALTTGDFTPEQAARALHALKAMEKMVKEGLPRLKRYAATHGGLRDGDSLWAPHEQAGKESTASVKRVRELVENGALTEAQANMLINKGPSTLVYRWRKAK